MNRKSSRDQRRRDAIRDIIADTTGNLELITDHELKIIKLALGDRIVLHSDKSTAGAAQAAQNVLDKLIRNEYAAKQAQQ